jgi:hypothetical protein
MSPALRWTSADLAVLPDNDKRYENIDGELYVSRQPHWHHQRTCGKIFAALEAWSMQTGAGEANFAPGVLFALEYWIVDWQAQQLEATAVRNWRCAWSQPCMPRTHWHPPCSPVSPVWSRRCFSTEFWLGRLAYAIAFSWYGPFISKPRPFCALSVAQDDRRSTGPSCRRR